MHSKNVIWSEVQQCSDFLPILCSEDHVVLDTEMQIATCKASTYLSDLEIYLYVWSY